ncbi:hypothetical protein HYT01_01060 [Candidatus Giovannonibacteria bacterium]|nr:hypothetical protein [Candidatus Giovannonibacteria bacterium]
MEITEAKLKEILKEQREDYQTHITALAEDFQSKLATGFEPLITLSQTLKSIQEMVAQNSEDITIMKSDIQFIKQELKQKVSVDEFSALEKRVLLLERRA